MGGEIEAIEVTVGIYQHEMHYLLSRKGAIVEQISGTQERMAGRTERDWPMHYIVWVGRSDLSAPAR